MARVLRRDRHGDSEVDRPFFGATASSSCYLSDEKSERQHAAQRTVLK